MSPAGGITASMGASFRPSGSGTFHHLIYPTDQDSMHPVTVGSDRSHDRRPTIGKSATTVPFPYLKPLFLPPILMSARPTPAERGSRHPVQRDSRGNTAHNCQPASNLL